MVPEGLVLLTSVAFGLAAVTLARKKVLVQELPAVEGLARVDVVCLDKTGTLTEGTIVFDELESLSADGNTATASSRARRWGRSPTTRTRTPPPSRSVSTSRRRDGRARARCRSRRPASGAQPASTATAPGSWGRRRWCSPTTRRRYGRVPTSSRPAAGARWCWRAATALTGETLPDDLEPVALVMFAEKVRPDAADTLAYFAAQGVQLRVISGDNPRTVAAVARTGRTRESRRRLRRPRAPRGSGRDGRRARAAPRLRPGHPAAEAGHGGGAAVEGPRRRHDRRRRERRARAEGRRHRRGHGIGRGRDARGRAARAPGREVLDLAGRGR